MNWIDDVFPGRLTIMARPLGAEALPEEIDRLRELGVERIVSLLTPEDNQRYGLGAEWRVAGEAGLGFLAFPIIDHGVPPLRRGTFDFLDRVEAALEGGESVAIHCFMGIGRSALVGAAMLVRAGLGSAEAFDRLSRCRDYRVPETLEQAQWVADYESILRAPKDPGER